MTDATNWPPSGSGRSFDTAIFDFYGTLAHATHWGEHPEKILTDRGYTYTEAVWLRFIMGHDGHEHVEASESKDAYEAWRRERLLSMLAESDVHPGEAHEIVERIRARVLDRTIEPYPEVHAALRTLRAQGIQIVICSNWDWDLNEAVAQAGLTDLIDVTVSSAWVGARKPHPRIFTATLARANAFVDRSVFVGDTWGPDVEGPLAVGLRPLYLERDEHWPDPTAPDDIATAATDLGVVRARDLQVLTDLP